MLNGWQYAAALFVGLVILGNYGPGDQRRNAKRLFLACALATALPLWMTIWTRGVELVLLQYGLTTGLVWLGLLIERQLLDMVVTRVRPRPAGTLPTLFVGPAEECRVTAAKSAFADDSEYRTVGFVDTQVPPADDALGHIVDFAAVLHDTRAEGIVVCGYLSDARFQGIVEAALTAGCRVLSLPRSIVIAGVAPVPWGPGARLSSDRRVPTVGGGS